jgi:hypothetical protein
MPPHSITLATGLWALSMLFAPARMLCQEPGSDSTSSVSPESQATSSDSGQQNGTPGRSLDTLGRIPSDTPGEVNRPPVAPDSLPSKGEADSTKTKADTTRKADSSAALLAPRDSILTAACTTPSGSASVARDLLVVVFTPDASQRERTAAAKHVAGKLLGPVRSGEVGAYYLRVPTGGQEFRLRAAADELARLAQVQQVGSRACPPSAPSGRPGASGLIGSEAILPMKARRDPSLAGQPDSRGRASLR